MDTKKKERKKKKGANHPKSYIGQAVSWVKVNFPPPQTCSMERIWEQGSRGSRLRLSKRTFSSPSLTLIDSRINSTLKILTFFPGQKVYLLSYPYAGIQILEDEFQMRRFLKNIFKSFFFSFYYIFFFFFFFFSFFGLNFLASYFLKSFF